MEAGRVEAEELDIDPAPEQFEELEGLEREAATFSDVRSYEEDADLNSPNDPVVTAPPATGGSREAVRPSSRTAS